MGSSLLVGMRVLVVEDEALIAMMIEQMLNDLGCTVIGPAHSLPQAMTLLEASPVSTAILDLNLRGAFVYPLARTLREGGIPFVFITGYTGLRIPHDFANTTTLTKPFAGADLIAALLNLTDRRSACS